MPEIGEIRKASEIGRPYDDSYIWHACLDCGKERWVTFRQGKPISQRCPICSGKKRKGTKWTRGQWEKLSGEKAVKFKGGRRKTRYGYIEVILPFDDFFRPMVDSHGYVKEHRLVMARHLGRCLLPWELVHHKGIRYTGIENRSDNLIDNLELLPTKKYHILDSHTQSLLKRLQKRIGQLEQENRLLKSELQKLN